MHYKVFLDTNIYDSSNYSFHNGLFTQLRKYAKEGTLELQINAIVEGETRRHISKNIGERIKELNKATQARELAGFRNTPSFASLLENQDKERWIRFAQDEFTLLLKDCHCEKIDLNGVDVETVFNDYFNYQYPFEQAKKDEFPDAFIIQSLVQQINRLSEMTCVIDQSGERKLLVFKDVRLPSGGLEELRFCVVSNDEGFRNAIIRQITNRYYDDVLIFTSLYELVNYIETQNNRACALQEEINKGFAREEIVKVTKEALEDLEYEVEEYDGEVEEVNTLNIDNINYKASVISLLEKHDNWATVRLYIESSYDVTLHYIYIDEDKSLWDPEEKEYVWALRMDKIALFQSKAQLTIEMKIEFDEEEEPTDFDFEQYVDRPYETTVSTNNLIKTIYLEKLPSDAE